MIVVSGLTKRYGAACAVSDLSFRIRPGVVTGFLGPNGAGKSTTMRLILGLDSPSAGSVTIDGKPHRQSPTPMHEVGALLDARAVHGGRSARSHLRCLMAVLISAVTPYVMAGDGRPAGLPKSVFDDFRTQLATHRSEFFQIVASGPFYGLNRPGAEPSEPVIQNWVRQAMTGAANAEHDEITAFCENFTEDLKKITVPVLVMQGEDDQVVNPDREPMAVGLVRNGTLKTYPGYPHGMPVTHADVLHPDLLAFIQS